MFTGLVEEIGECLWLRQSSDAMQLMLTAGGIAKGIRNGDSVSINGCCLTVTSHRKEHRRPRHRTERNLSPIEQRATQGDLTPNFANIQDPHKGDDTGGQWTEHQSSPKHQGQVQSERDTPLRWHGHESGARHEEGPRHQHV